MNTFAHFADYHTLSDCRWNLMHPSPAFTNAHKFSTIISYFLAILLDSFCPAPCCLCIRVIWDQALDCSSQMFCIIRLSGLVSAGFFIMSLPINQNIAGNLKCMNISLYWPAIATSMPIQHNLECSFHQKIFQMETANLLDTRAFSDRNMSAQLHA